MSDWLKATKNKVIGNKLAKDACARDGSIPKYAIQVACPCLQVFTAVAWYLELSLA